jgi:catechol-2,3-dioxygenase
VTLALEPRVAQKAHPRMPLNVPGEAVRLDARSPAVLASEPARPRRLSHVVTSSTDTAATKRFFVEGLGFCVSDDVPELGASFLRCSTDHHNLLVLPAPLVFLHHSAWEMDDLDAVGRAGAAMVAADASRHVWGLGRHAIGSNYFWYRRDPAGNFAEYTSDLDVATPRLEGRLLGPGARARAWGRPCRATRARRHHGARRREG